MRRTLSALLPLLLTLPLGAQGFEGTLNMRMTSAGTSEPITTTMHIKGDVMAMVMTLPASAGPMAGMEARMVLDQGARKMTMLMPMPAGMPAMPGAKGMKIVTDLSKMESESAKLPEPTLKKLGTSQTVAGMACDDYQVTSGQDVTNMCVTDKLGRFTLPSGGVGSQPPAWARAFGNKPMFPLKVWTTTDGNSVAMEVLSVKRGAAPAGVFDVSPAGYQDMSAMMGGGMGRRND
ncbi:MAG TPA: DUF4412 domain-containing protein [Gemmatimonadales bacterium]|nr:DUF4412 domain-containing protein [Gemmatimonadales bacterium]